MTNEQIINEIKELFEEVEIPFQINLTIEKLEEFALMKGLTLDQLHTLLMNLEDSTTMKNIANGDFSTFNCYDRSQFNDSYYDIFDDIFEIEDEESEE